MLKVKKVWVSVIKQRKYNCWENRLIDGEVWDNMANGKIGLESMIEHDLVSETEKRIEKTSNLCNYH